MDKRKVKKKIRLPVRFIPAPCAFTVRIYIKKKSWTFFLRAYVPAHPIPTPRARVLFYYYEVRRYYS